MTRDEWRARIASFAELRPGWAGGNEDAIDPGAIGAALVLLDQIPDDLLPNVFFAPTGDGAVFVEDSLRCGVDDAYFSVDIYAEDHVEMLGFWGTNDEDYEAHVDDPRLVATIRNVIEYGRTKDSREPLP
jgi:hypothetical protein